MSLRSPEKIQKLKEENNKRILQQQEKETKAIKKYVKEEKSSSRKSYVIIYKDYSEKYFIDEYGYMGDVDVSYEMDRLNYDMLKRLRYKEIKK